MNQGRLVIRLFGEPSIQFDGEPWPFKAPSRCFAVLALLVLGRGNPRARPSPRWFGPISPTARRA
jgi:DNA-binding SARP family transcriptional activator